MVDWTQVLMALAVGLPATIAAITAGIASLRAVRKVDENTAITKTVAKDAEIHRTAAAKVVSENLRSAVLMVDEKQVETIVMLAKMLNGALDEKVRVIVKEEVGELKRLFAEHATADDENMQEIRRAIVKLGMDVGKLRPLLST